MFPPFIDLNIAGSGPSRHRGHRTETFEVYSEWQRCHYFELQLAGECPESWIHTFSKGDQDKDLVFVYEWWSLERAILELAGGKDEALKEVLA